MRKLLGNKDADMNMVLAAIVMAITLAIGIIIVYNVLAATDVSDADADIRDNLFVDVPFGGSGHGEHELEKYNGTAATPGANASTDLINNVNTFYTIAPIALIVVAAVGILSYVLLLRRR